MPKPKANDPVKVVLIRPTFIREVGADGVKAFKAGATVTVPYNHARELIHVGKAKWPEGKEEVKVDKK